MAAEAGPGVQYMSHEQAHLAEFTTRGRTSEAAPVPRAIRTYFGEVRETRPGPQAFLVENPAHATVRPHFHPVDQFQVLFPAAGAWYGSHAVAEVLLHYADANVTYGPFGSSDRPFSFFTLRPTATARTHFMPEERHRLPPRPRPRHRNVHATVPSRWTITPGAGAIEAHSLVAPAGDGLLAELWRLPPGARQLLPQPRRSAGRYYCVLDGALVESGREYGARSLAWVPSGVPTDPVCAGGRGCVFLVLQFPVSA